MTTKPLNTNDIFSMAQSGEPIPADRALATYADPSNWVQLYHGESSDRSYVPKACEWAFIGPMRPGYELAQHALKDRDQLHKQLLEMGAKCAVLGAAIQDVLNRERWSATIGTGHIMPERDGPWVLVNHGLLEKALSESPSTARP